MQKTITQTTNGFEARYQDQLIATEPTEAQAREKLNEYLYDLERGRVPAAPAEAAPAEGPAPTPGSVHLDGGLTVTLMRDEEEANDPGYLLYRLGGAEVTIEQDWAGLPASCLFFRGHEMLDYVPSGVKQYACDMTGAETREALRDLARLLSHPTVRVALGLEMPEVRLERYVNDDDVRAGLMEKPYTGWSFLAGECEVFIADGHNPADRPSLHGFSTSIDIREVEGLLPALNALFSDPRVAEARRRWEAGLPFEAPPC